MQSLITFAILKDAEKNINYKIFYDCCDEN